MTDGIGLSRNAGNYGDKSLFFFFLIIHPLSLPQLHAVEYLPLALEEGKSGFLNWETSAL
jgi:hypothetical protein